MYPGETFDLLGVSVSIWNAMFLVGIVAGWVVFRIQAMPEHALTFRDLRFMVVVYLSAVAAKAFASAFDASTTMLPPPGVGALTYYFDPLYGPKTLYGVIVAMPLTLRIAIWGAGLSLWRCLDLWTQPMLVVLAMARVGCFLEGCCFGVRSENFGLHFAPGSSVYWQQHAAGEIASGALHSLPVLPVQAIEAATLAGLALLCCRLSGRSRAAEGWIFGVAVGGYSVFRFVIEFFRADLSRGLYGPLSTSQWIAMVVLCSVGAAAWLAKLRESSAKAEIPLEAVGKLGASAADSPVAPARS